MPNQLSIPFKKTYVIPIKQTLRDYLYAHGDSHPDAFKWDINRWEELRKDGVGGRVHVDRVNAAVRCACFMFSSLGNNLNVLSRYHAQLVSILTKLPVDVSPRSEAIARHAYHF
jgi:programmed cell death 6-interacting protein